MKTVLSLLAALLLSTALAHTEVTSVTPARGAAVSAPPAVTLSLSEPVNLRFSTFRVLAVPAGRTAAQAAALAFAAKTGAPQLANLPVRAAGTASAVRIPLKPALKKGVYVVAWKLLSDDGHPVSSFSVFRVK